MSEEAYIKKILNYFFLSYLLLFIQCF